jgi:hypothetical protein
MNQLGSRLFVLRILPRAEEKERSLKAGDLCSNAHSSDGVRPSPDIVGF